MAGGSLAEHDDAHHQHGADLCSQKLAALVEHHVLLDHVVRLEDERLRDRQPRAFAVLRLMINSNLVAARQACQRAFHP
jgi:hypothetical protein